MARPQGKIKQVFRPERAARAGPTPTRSTGLTAFIDSHQVTGPTIAQ